MIRNNANHLKYNYFLHGDGIDNVTLRLWKFSDFCLRHTVGVAADDIMLHILVDVNFDALAQASDFRIERKQVVFLCWVQDSKLCKDGSRLSNVKYRIAQAYA